MASLSIALPTITPPSNLVGVLSLRNVILSWIPVTALIRHQIWRSTTTSLADAVLYDTLTSDVTTYTDPEVVVGQTYSYWVKSLDLNGLTSAAVGPATVTVKLITSQDTVQSPPTSLGFGVGSGVVAGSISTYNTWNVVTFADFYVDPCSNALISVSMLARVFTSGATGGSFGNPYATVLRTRLRDNTTGQDVAASIKMYVLYEHNGFQPAGTERALMNINETFVAGFRGLIVPGHSYSLYAEAMKQRTGTTATANVEISGVVTSSGSSSI